MKGVRLLARMTRDYSEPAGRCYRDGIAIASDHNAAPVLAAMCRRLLEEQWAELTRRADLIQDCRRGMAHITAERAQAEWYHYHAAQHRALCADVARAWPDAPGAAELLQAVGE